MGNQSQAPKNKRALRSSNSAGQSGITGIRNRKAKRTALSKARYLAAQLPADLANDGVDEGGLGHLELASRHERDGQGNQPTRHDIR